MASCATTPSNTSGERPASGAGRNAARPKGMTNSPSATAYNNAELTAKPAVQCVALEVSMADFTAAPLDNKPHTAHVNAAIHLRTLTPPEVATVRYRCPTRTVSRKHSNSLIKTVSGRMGTLIPSCVPSQPAGIPNFRSMLSCDNHLTHGICLDHRNSFLVINVLHLIRPEIIIKEFIIVRHQERQNQFHKQQGQGPLSQEMTSKIKAQFQCRHLQDGRRP